MQVLRKLNSKKDGKSFMTSLIIVLVSGAITIYSYALIVYILMSWFPGARESQFGELLGSICEPYLEQFRKFIPPIGMIDISPIAGIIVLQMARIGVVELFNVLGLCWNEYISTL